MRVNTTCNGREAAMLNELFGPSIRLQILDLFLKNPDKLMNLREVARAIDKNPGSISRVIPHLVEQGFLKRYKVGRNSYVYCLNIENEVVKLLLEFTSNLKVIISESEVSNKR